MQLPESTSTHEAPPPGQHAPVATVGAGVVGAGVGGAGMSVGGAGVGAGVGTGVGASVNGTHSTAIEAFVKHWHVSHMHTSPSETQEPVKLTHATAVVMSTHEDETHSPARSHGAISTSLPVSGHTCATHDGDVHARAISPPNSVCT